MMNKKKSLTELEVDFIGGEELTREEEAELSKFFANKKKQRRKEGLTANRKKKVPAK